MGHIEVILAIVIFVGFVVFALYFLNPLETDRIVESSLTYGIDEISDKIESDMISYSVVFKDVNANIVSIPLQNSENFKIRVETNEGQKLNSKYSGGRVVLNRAGNEFVIVKFSEFYNEDLLSGEVLLGPENFSISSSGKQKVWSEEKALELNESYFEDYQALKKEFNLPGRVNFGFSFDVLDGNSFRSENPVPDGLEVFTKSERRETIRSDESMGFADLTVSVW